MIIYYCITIAANIGAALIFYKSINITGLSVLPLILIALMVFQAIFFRNEKAESGFETNYGSDLTANEKNKMFESGSKFLFATVPFMIPFVIFFPSPVKAVSVLVYIVGLCGGLVLYRLRNKNGINDRIAQEEKERQEQERKEKSGIFK